jgi:hypothetical protein
MAFAKIKWKPTPRELRLFALVLPCAFGLVGTLFYFVFDKTTFALFLWSFGVVTFLTAITGTRLGLPCYYLWMGFVYGVSQVLGYTVLGLIYFLVVTPLGFLAKAVGRDRLLRRQVKTNSYWQDCPPPTHADNFEKQY